MRRIPAFLATAALAACDSSAVENQPPHAELVVPELAGIGEVVILDASGSLDPDGFVILYRYVFSDGSPAIITSSSTLDRMFPQPGLYDVAVVVTDDRGAESRADATINIIDKPVLECDDGLSACDGECVDTQIDPQNCGGCGIPCLTSCVAGECTISPVDCIPPLENCGGECVDIMVDDQHCGGCDLPCASACGGGWCMGMNSGELVTVWPTPFPGQAVTGLTAVGGLVFWITTGGHTVSRFDLPSLAVDAQFTIPDPATRLSYGLARHPVAGQLALGTALQSMPATSVDFDVFNVSGMLGLSVDNLGGATTVDADGMAWVFRNGAQELLQMSFAGDIGPSVDTEGIMFLTDLAWDYDGKIWGARQRAGAAPPQLVQIDPVTGGVAEFPVPSMQGFGGIVVSEGWLWAAGPGGIYQLVP